MNPICDICSNKNTQLVQDRSRSGWPYLWKCNNCKSTIGCHNGTYLPLGKFATSVTRFRRKKAHDCFDEIWKAEFMSREKAYRWMAEKLNIAEFHIAHCTDRQLEFVIETSIEYLEKRGIHKIQARKKRKHENMAREIRATAKRNEFFSKRRKRR